MTLNIKKKKKKSQKSAFRVAPCYTPRPKTGDLVRVGKGPPGPRLSCGIFQPRRGGKGSSSEGGWCSLQHCQLLPLARCLRPVAPLSPAALGLRWPACCSSECPAWTCPWALAHLPAYTSALSCFPPRPSMQSQGSPSRCPPPYAIPSLLHR